MRPLTEEETKLLFEKLSHFIGENIRLLLDRKDSVYCFRLHKDRIYYLSEKLMNQALSFPRSALISAGTCFGKFTKSGKVHLHITALEYLSPYAEHKVWLKPSAEQQFLYGHHVIKSGLARITENTAKYQGVVIYSMKDIPLGFGAAAKSTAECRHADPTTLVVFHQADIGQYIRQETTLT